MKHFNIKEFQCHCGCEMPPEAQQNIEILVKEILATSSSPALLNIMATSTK